MKIDLVDGLSDAVADIGIYFETGDEIVSAFGIGGKESCFSKYRTTQRDGPQAVSSLI
jgi:hypothetical protein